MSEDLFHHYKQCRPWWNAALCCISFGSSVFVKPINGFPRIQVSLDITRGLGSKELNKNSLLKKLKILWVNENESMALITKTICPVEMSMLELTGSSLLKKKNRKKILKNQKAKQWPSISSQTTPKISQNYLEEKKYIGHFSLLK